VLFRALSLRAVGGGLLVTLALLGVSQAYARADEPPTTRYLVAARTLPPGSVLDAGALDAVPADLPSALAGRAFTDPRAVDGAVTLAPLQAGDLVLASHVRPADGAAPDGGADLSFAITADRAVAGRLQPGERVDLVASYDGVDRPARLAARDALVVAVAASSDSLLDDGTGLVLTVRVSGTAPALEVVQAVDHGQLTVVRSAP
jgi:Flp pilus assembly protein CpaB